MWESSCFCLFCKAIKWQQNTPNATRVFINFHFSLIYWFIFFTFLYVTGPCLSWAGGQWALLHQSVNLFPNGKLPTVLAVQTFFSWKICARRLGPLNQPQDCAEAFRNSTICPLVLPLHQSPNRPEKIHIFSERCKKRKKQKREIPRRWRRCSGGSFRPKQPSPLLTQTASGLWREAATDLICQRREGNRKWWVGEAIELCQRHLPATGTQNLISES